MRNKEEIFKLLRESVETPQESFAVEEMISKIEGNLPPIETVSDTKKTFNGINFYKDPRGNYVCSTTLHRFIWLYVNGEIPEGYEIHHRDFNHDNNDISNLELLQREEHIAIHKELKKNKKPVMKKEKFVCVYCGKEYEAFHVGSNKYCSAECRYAAAREQYDETRVCPQCGKSFSAYKYGKQKFCSYECMFASMRKQEIKVCIVCGKQMSVKQSRNRKFCSRACFYEYRKLHPSDHPVRPKNARETRICPQCGKEFIAEVKSTQRFCSMTCFREYRKLHPSEYPTRPMKARETRICPQCGKEFTFNPYRDRKYCSRECFNKARRKNPDGE